MRNDDHAPAPRTDPHGDVRVRRIPVVAVCAAVAAAAVLGVASPLAQQIANADAVPAAQVQTLAPDVPQNPVVVAPAELAEAVVDIPTVTAQAPAPVPVAPHRARAAQSAAASPAAPATGPTYAERIAAQYGLSVVFTNAQACGTAPSVDTETQFAGAGCYTPGTRYLELSTSAAYRGDAGWKLTAIRNLTLHEVAHALVARTYGVVDPAAAGGRFENMTDAYAWLYLGTGKAAGGYGFGDADLAAAQAVHDGL